MKQLDLSETYKRIAKLRASEAQKMRTFSGVCPIHGAYTVKKLPDDRGRYSDHVECPHCQSLKKTEKDRYEAIVDTFRRRSLALSDLLRACSVYQAPSATFDEFIAETDDQKRAKRIAMRFASAFLERQLAQRNADCGLFLFGGCGNGKTHIAMAILDNLSKQGIPGFFIRVPDLFDLINQKNDFPVTKLISSLCGVSCLVLDDLGVQSWSKAEQKRLQQIIEGRQCQGVPTVFTTNLDGSNLVACLDQRIISRIAASTYAMHFSWADHRKSAGYATRSAEELFFWEEVVA